MGKTLLAYLIIFLFPLACFGAPAISGVSGSVTAGSSITITGSDFGSKSTAAPAKYDTFENGSNGATLYSVDNDWKVYAGNDTYATSGGTTYFNSSAHSGSLSVGDHITNGESFKSNLYILPTPQVEMYISYWWRTVNGDTGDNTTIKMTRLNSSQSAGGGGYYNGAGNTSMGGTYNLLYTDDRGYPYVAYNDGATTEAGLHTMTAPSLNAWTRIEVYKKLSTAGVADGIFEARIIGRDYHLDSAAMTRASGQSFLLDTVLLGTMDGNDGNHDYYILLDDMYIDTTRARVEIGDSATWENCTHREIQPPSAWSDESATITLNTGSFSDGTAYLFVVDADGTASAGYEITLGSSFVQLPSFVGGTCP